MPLHSTLAPSTEPDPQEDRRFADRMHIQTGFLLGLVRLQRADRLGMQANFPWYSYTAGFVDGANTV